MSNVGVFGVETMRPMDESARGSGYTMGGNGYRVVDLALASNREHEDRCFSYLDSGNAAAGDFGEVC